MSEIEFRQRWREELEAVAYGRTLVFELTIGRWHLYFPSEERWAQIAPEWAKPRWAEYHEAAAAWCKARRFPMTVVDDAHMSEESP